MQIQNMFSKDIDRNIQGVIKVDQERKDKVIRQELEEYVVTEELLKHFGKFFKKYNSALNNPTDEIGVWISGFYGSGKSHFLKILSYLLDSKLIVDNKKPIDIFKESKKIEDEEILKDMECCNNSNTDIMLFNIVSKSNLSSENILDVFIKVFNEMRGFSSISYLAELEEELEDKGKFDEFKKEYLKLSDEDWESDRKKIKFGKTKEKVFKALDNVDFMSYNDAKEWFENNNNNKTDISIENFAEKVNNYCEKKRR